jgi:hypothetical protein
VGKSTLETWKFHKGRLGEDWRQNYISKRLKQNDKICFLFPHAAGKSLWPSYAGNLMRTFWLHCCLYRKLPKRTLAISRHSWDYILVTDLIQLNPLGPTATFFGRFCWNLQGMWRIVKTEFRFFCFSLKWKIMKIFAIEISSFFNSVCLFWYQDWPNWNSV